MIDNVPPEARRVCDEFVSKSRRAPRTMSRVKWMLALLAVAVAAATAGCGSSSGAREPREDPGAVMRQVIQLELTGKLDRSWQMLIREQRRIVDRRLYRQCVLGPPVEKADVVILGVADQMFDVAALGRTKTKAVRWKLTTHEVGLGKVTVSHTGHLVQEDGRWHWTLSAASLQHLRAGSCP
jgi:hypothetical protein